MEPENANQPVTEDNLQNNSLHQVTPLSKYLAMALFVILPFLGGYIGYTFTSEKIVEVERVVTKEVSSDSAIDEPVSNEPFFQITQSEPRYSEETLTDVFDATVFLVDKNTVIKLIKVYEGSCKLKGGTAIENDIIWRIPGVETYISEDDSLISVANCFGRGQFFYDLFLIEGDTYTKVLGVLDDPTGGPDGGNPYSEPEVLYVSQY